MESQELYQEPRSQRATLNYLKPPASLWMAWAWSLYDSSTCTPLSPSLDFFLIAFIYLKRGFKARQAGLPSIGITGESHCAWYLINFFYKDLYKNIVVGG